MSDSASFEQVLAAIIASEKAILSTTMESIQRRPAASHGNLYGWGIARRAIALSSGYRLLVDQTNSIGALPMVRMQLDTALRLYAGFFAPDALAFCTAVIDGQQIDKLKSDDGEKMRDRYLLERVATSNPWMLEVYKLTSGYIHFSSRHIFEVFRPGEGDREMKLVIGPNDQGREPADFHEPSRCLHHLNLIIECALRDWFETKC